MDSRFNIIGNYGDVHHKIAKDYRQHDGQKAFLHKISFSLSAKAVRRINSPCPHEA